MELETFRTGEETVTMALAKLCLYCILFLNLPFFKSILYYSQLLIYYSYPTHSHYYYIWDWVWVVIFLRIIIYYLLSEHDKVF